MSSQNHTGSCLSRTAAIAIAAAMLLVAACKSDWVDATIENHTGNPVRQLEVNYPSASFGTNTLSPGNPMHYRFKIRGSGPIRVEFISQDGTTIHAQGLTLEEKQHGALVIRLLPHGKVEFIPSLQPAS